MAKYERMLKGEYIELLTLIENGILRGSISANLEDASNFVMGDVRCAVRVFERYSIIGSSRVSLSVTLVARGEDLCLSAIAAGGSQAMFFKINTFGEEAFLSGLSDIVDRYVGRR